MRLLATRIGLAGITLVALGAFAVYAAFLASQAGDITEATPINIPGQGPSQPFSSGQRAPDFTLTTLEGQPVSLADFAGRPVWINVWASWCAPCRAEMPDISTVYHEVQAREGQTQADGLVLLMVSLGEQPKDVQQYVDSTRYRLPVLVDPEFRFTDRYRVTGLPTHYFIGRDGIIRDLAIGGLKPNAMRARLAKITQ